MRKADAVAGFERGLILPGCSLFRGKQLGRSGASQREYYQSIANDFSHGKHENATLISWQMIQLLLPVWAPGEGGLNGGADFYSI